MQDSRINYVIVGSFVAVVLAIFIMVVSMLAGRSGATDSYYTVYDNVGGLKFGTQVLYEGYQIALRRGFSRLPVCSIAHSIAHSIASRSPDLRSAPP